MLLQLAALDEGLVAGVFGVLPEQVPELKAAVGMPAEVHFVGYDTVDVAACTRAGVLVVNQSGANAAAVAEHERRGYWR